jgi:hypothetical protein
MSMGVERKSESMLMALDSRVFTYYLLCEFYLHSRSWLFCIGNNLDFDQLNERVSDFDVHKSYSVFGRYFLI